MSLWVCSGGEKADRQGEKGLAGSCWAPITGGTHRQAGKQANRGKLTSAIEDHATGAGQVMLLQALLIDGLLGDDVAGSEEDGRGDDLCQQGPTGQLGLVPGVQSISIVHTRLLHEAVVGGIEVLTI